MAASQHRRHDKRPLRAAGRIALTIAIAASVGGSAQASARTASAFRVVARNQDELGVWHVTALLPQLVASKGKAVMETGSVLARVDCRQRVLRIDAWSLRALAAEDAEGWRPPANAQDQALFNAVCQPAPQLRERVQALTSPSRTAVPALAQKTAPERPSTGRPPSIPRFAAQIGLFTSKTAADQALAKALARMSDPSALKPLTVRLPGPTLTFRALLGASTIKGARDVCEAERRVATRSTCWIRPVNP